MGGNYIVVWDLLFSLSVLQSLDRSCCPRFAKHDRTDAGVKPDAVEGRMSAQSEKLALEFSSPHVI